MIATIRKAKALANQGPDLVHHCRNQIWILHENQKTTKILFPHRKNHENTKKTENKTLKKQHELGNICHKKIIKDEKNKKFLPKNTSYPLIFTFNFKKSRYLKIKLHQKIRILINRDVT